MLYKKPDNVSYTDMAMTIDAHIHDEDFDKEILFEYMWHLFYILAVKGMFFTSARDYDEYALYAATHLYMRYKRTETKTGKKLKPIKSCLNYIKKILYPMKVNYQKQYFEQAIRKEDANEDSIERLQGERENMARKAMMEAMPIEYESYLQSIPGTIKNVLIDSPYANDKLMIHKIYVSCLLSLLKTITISNVNKHKIEKRAKRALALDGLIDRIYKQERDDNIVLYHLDNSMKNYISTLLSFIRKEVVKDLRGIVGSFEPSEQVIKDILTSPIEEYVSSKNINFDN